MEHFIFSYGINTQEILAVFGSKDRAIRNRIKENEVFAEYDEHELDFGYYTNALQALDDILLGNPYDEECNFSYGYALIGIAATLGVALPCNHEIAQIYDTQLIDKFAKEDFGIENLNIQAVLLGNEDNVFELPEIDDWPLFGLVDSSQLAALNKMLEVVDIDQRLIDKLQQSPLQLDQERGEAYQHLSALKSNVSFCTAKQLELISFCH